MSDSFSTTALATTAASVVLVPVLWNTIGGLVRQSLISKLTILNDMPKLGGANKRGKKIRGTAIVCGGSIAGLWTARVCAEHFDNVIVIEPETWIAPGRQVDTQEYVAAEIREKDGTRYIVNKRTRVWRYHGVHAFQPLAVIAFRKLFPDFDDEARSMEIQVAPADTHMALGGVPLSPPFSAYPGGKIPEVLNATRASFETLLRKLVRKSEACKNVEFVTGTVTGVVPSDGGLEGAKRLGGVQVRRERGNEPTFISGELVIGGPIYVHHDGAGFKWLPRAGFGSSDASLIKQPALSDLRVEYDQRMSYSCFQYSITPEMNVRLSKLFPPSKEPYNPDTLREGWDKAAWLFAHVPIPEDDNKIVMRKKLEGNRVEIACGGWAVDPLPRTNAEILEFVDSMVPASGFHVLKWVRDFLDVLCAEEEPEPVLSIYPAPASSYIQYHQAPNMPSDFVAIGDAAMKLNPVFAKACIGAVTLSSLLAEVRTDSLPQDFGKKFFNLHDARTNGFWVQVKGQDYRFETTEPVKGEENELETTLQNKGDLMGSFMMDMAKLAMVDEEARLALWHVFNMLAPPTDLFSPSLLSRLMWAKLRGSI